MKLLIILTLLFSYSFCAPAFSKLRELKNADGTTFMARAKGNQHLNWIESEDGEILRYNKRSKNFEYAKIEGERLKASGVKYERKNSIRARAIGRVNKLNRDSLYRLWSQKHKQDKERRSR